MTIVDELGDIKTSLPGARTLGAMSCAAAAARSHLLESEGRARISTTIRIAAHALRRGLATFCSMASQQGSCMAKGMSRERA
jgi:hypothetical protein